MNFSLFYVPLISAVMIGSQIQAAGQPANNAGNGGASAKKEVQCALVSPSGASSSVGTQDASVEVKPERECLEELLRRVPSEVASFIPSADVVEAYLVQKEPGRLVENVLSNLGIPAEIANRMALRQRKIVDGISEPLSLKLKQRNFDLKAHVSSPLEWAKLQFDIFNELIRINEGMFEELMSVDDQVFNSVVDDVVEFLSNEIVEKITILFQRS